MDTEAKEFTVMPKGPNSDWHVTTVTPVAKRLRAAR